MVRRPNPSRSKWKKWLGWRIIRNQIRSLVGGFDVWNNSLASPDKEARERGRGMISRLMETAKIMGVDAVLVIPAFVKETGASYDDCYWRSQEQLALLVPEAEKMKVHLCIENIWNRFLLSPLEMARYVDELNSDYVGVYFDVGNILVADSGSVLSHAAIMAREYGIPAVMACGNATQTFTDGDRIEVDGSAGTVCRI